MNFKNYWSSDFPASVVVFLVALPLCLGIALASGAPMFSGLLAGIVGGIVVGTLSGSTVSVSGPAAGLTTIVAAAILDLGSFESFLLAVVIAGVLQVILGFAKAGSIGHFFPSSVIKGMLAAIGIILILKQIPHALGYDEDFEGDENFFQPDGRNTFSEIMQSMDFISPGALIVSVLTMALIIAWGSGRLQKITFFKVIPAPLAAVLLGIGLNALFNSSFPDLVIADKHLVSVPKLSESDGLSSFLIFPDFTQWQNPKIYVVAFTLAIVASLESLLSIEATDRMDYAHHITPLNRELKAQGTGNIISGFLGGLPLTSVIVRSSANINSGAKSKASTITHGTILAMSVLLIPGVLQMIPLSCLAAILISVGFKLTKPSFYKVMYGRGWAQFLPFIVTILAVILTNLLQGVIFGIVVSVFFILKTNFQKSVIVVHSEDNYLIQFTKDVSFLHKNALRQALERVPSNKRLLIDGSKAQFMDQDIKEMVVDFTQTAKDRNIEIELKNIHLH